MRYAHARSISISEVDRTIEDLKDQIEALKREVANLSEYFILVAELS